MLMLLVRRHLVAEAGRAYRHPACTEPLGVASTAQTIIRSPRRLRATGATGAQGPSGNVALVTGKKIFTKVKGHRRKRQKCIGRLVSGPVKFIVAGAAERVTVTRARRLYARGASVGTWKGGFRLAVQDVRALEPGRYTLTLRRRDRHGWRTRHLLVTIT